MAIEDNTPEIQTTFGEAAPSGGIGNVNFVELLKNNQLARPNDSAESLLHGMTFTEQTFSTSRGTSFLTNPPEIRVNQSQFLSTGPTAQLSAMNRFDGKPLH